MGKDTSGPGLEEEQDVCTQQLAEKRVRTFSIHGRRIGDAHHRSWWSGGEEGGLEEGALNLL